VVIDIYSRYVPGWLLARAERAHLAERLLADTIAKQHIIRDQLTIHADRGTSMASKPVAFLLADLGVTKSHSRPHTSNDNPYSESQFKTLKHRPEFPDRFGCLEDAHAFWTRFFRWYNHEHPPLRDRLPHPRRCPLRPGRARPSPAGHGAGRRLHRPSRAVRPQASDTAPAADGSVDQQARGGHARHNESLINLSHRR
jgi:hypothetical protein